MPAVCRGDSVDCDVVHCSKPQRAQRSDNVKVNGIGISRQGDNNTPHLLPAPICPVHAAPIATGSTTVFINSKGCGRIGDAISGLSLIHISEPTRPY